MSFDVTEKVRLSTGTTVVERLCAAHIFTIDTMSDTVDKDTGEFLGFILVDIGSDYRPLDGDTCEERII